MEFIVETRFGRLAGREAEGLRTLRGVPFAAPPVGRRRFRAPAPAEPWPGVRDASAFGRCAPQNPSVLGAMLGLGVGDPAEDCLSLNVFAPSAPGARRPVMVWLHGGGFTFGAGSQPMYDGRRLALAGDAVVVTVNYRLGALGWLGLPALAREDEGAFGNFGLLDQIAALEWVRDHVDRFGGDPSNVTVFGESAGAMSVGTLLGTPRARGLFRRAVLQSGAAHNVATPEIAERVAEAFMKELGLEPGDVARLREAPVPAILDAQQRCILRVYGELRGLPFQPVQDGELLAEPAIDAIAEGCAREVSVLIGTNQDEWRLFSMADSKLPTLDDAGLQRRLERLLPGLGLAGAEHARRAIEVYRAARSGRGEAATPADLWLAFEADRVFRIPAIRLAEAQRRHHTEVYSYLFDWASPALGGRLGSCHALEIPFVFGGVDDPGLRTFVGEGDAVRRLSATMQSAWLAFARDGAPEAARGWPGYDAERRATKILGADVRLAHAPQDEERRFWDGLL